MAAIGTLPVVLATGDHASRPAANAVGVGGLYSCTTHRLIYQTDGASWTTWGTLGTTETRASLGLDTTDSPEFAGLNVGAATDTTITRTGAGDIAVEGNALYRAGGTDVPVADGGTGASTASAARGNLGALADTDAITYLDGTVAAAPATPAAGKLRIYAKTGPSLAVKNDAGVETVLGAGIADQGAFTYLDATEAAAPSTPAAGKVRIYAKADGRVYSKDDAGVESGPFSSGGALTGERKPWDVAASYPLNADGSEFEYADLTAFNAFWTRRNVADAHIYCPPGSQTEFYFNADGDWIYRAWPGANPTDVKVVAEISENRDGDGNMFGVGIVDTSGNGVGFVCYSGNFYQIAIATWAYSSLGNTGNPSAAEYDEFMNGGHAWMILERISTTQYQGGVSLPSNGTTITHRPTAFTPTSFTPAWFGVFRAFTSGKSVWRRIHRINLYTSTFP